MFDVATPVQIQRDGELEGIQRAQARFRPITFDQLSRLIVVCAGQSNDSEDPPRYVFQKTVPKGCCIAW